MSMPHAWRCSTSKQTCSSRAVEVRLRERCPMKAPSINVKGKPLPRSSDRLILLRGIKSLPLFTSVFRAKIPEPNSRRAKPHQCSSGFGCKRIALHSDYSRIYRRNSFLSPFPPVRLRWKLSLITKVAECLIGIPLHNFDVKCLLAYTVFIKPRWYIPTGVMRKKRL